MKKLARRGGIFSVLQVTEKGGYQEKKFKRNVTFKLLQRLKQDSMVKNMK